ncbi:MAG TPA: 3-keto-5-aminohexanoate cleavage protein [Thermodesulfobacteriota bacterium]
MTPVIVAVAPNGASKTRADHPALPITAEEIATCARACRDAGAAMIHLHVRDREGRHTLDVDAYREATAAIRCAVGDGLVIQATTEAAGVYGPEAQMALVRALRPEAVSLAIREILPPGRDEREAAAFLAWLAAERIVPQYILYSTEDLTRFRELRRRGLIPGSRPFALFVLGRYTVGQESDPRTLLPFLASLDEAEEMVWAVCAFGRREAACVLAAAALGGHARVGFENNLLLADGRRAPDNAAVVAQLVDGLRVIGRPLADAAGARALLGGSGGASTP